MTESTMLRRFALIALIAFAPLSITRAQHGGPGAAPAPVAPREATQFDFLLGQWDLTVKLAPSNLGQRIHGTPKVTGVWKAWRGFDGWGVEDELRLLDASANPVALLHSVRLYDNAAKRWNISGADAYRAHFTSANAEWKNGEMIVMAKGVDQGGKAYVHRNWFYAISATGFKYQQDRSQDDGRSWDEGVLKIEAKRVSATAPR